MNGGGVVMLERDRDLLCEPVGGSRQWMNDTVKLSLDALC